MHHQSAELRTELAALHDDIIAAIEARDYGAIPAMARRATLLQATLRRLFG